MTALLIVLSIIGGITVLAGLYLAGVEIAVVITSRTKIFKTRVSEIIEQHEKKKLDKLAAKETAKNIINEVNTEELKLEVDKVLEDLKL